MALDLQHKVDWQLQHPTLPTLYPWYSWPFLAQLETWDVSDATVLEFGAGWSSIWWAFHCKHIDSIEANEQWATDVQDYAIDHRLFNLTVHYANLREGIAEDEPKYFSLVPQRKDYNIIICDGIFRTSVVKWAIEYFKQNGGGVLILENWQQDFVWISPEAERLMQPYKIYRYEQPGHTDHDGSPWNTSFAIIPPSTNK